jgi:hypothetical protein
MGSPYTHTENPSLCNGSDDHSQTETGSFLAKLARQPRLINTGDEEGHPDLKLPPKNRDRYPVRVQRRRGCP